MDPLESLLAVGQSPTMGQILETIVPTRNQPYTLDNIEQRVNLFCDCIEEQQRKSNDRFDSLLDKKTIDRLFDLNRNIHNLQLDIMKLQCDIAFAREQCDSVKATCNNPLVQERRDMLDTEDRLRTSLQLKKFEPIREFFERFTSHLNDTAATFGRLWIHHVINHFQLFDWTQYSRIIFLLRACGQALLDMEKFERLYQSKVQIVSMNLRQPVSHMDMSNFVEFQETYSLESQLLITRAPDRQQSLKELVADPDLKPILESDSPLEYILFKTTHSRLESATVECCKLLVDLNMNYIEAHLTDGMTIDKLNGYEGGSLSPTDDVALPLYAFSPQEYITQIGQHLLTLRKQTEQYDSKDNCPLKFSLNYLKQAQNVLHDVQFYGTVTEIVMRCIARHCIRSFLGRTSNSVLANLTSKGKRQLATDALYLDNVLEDLGLLDSAEPNVDKFKSLLMQS